MQVVDILKADPKHFYANYLPLSYDGAAVCATTINDINKINALKDVETTSSAFYLNLGTFCENANLLDAAITLYDKACYCTKLIGKLLSYDNGAMTWKPYASLGNAYFKAGKISKAIDAYRLALSENQVLPEIWAQASRLYIALENIPMAETYMKEAIKHKNDKVNNIALANIYIASERLKPGVELYFKWAAPEQLIALMQEMHRNGFTDIVDDIQHVLDSREHAFTMPNSDMPLLENSVTIIMPTLLVAPTRWIERSLEEAEKCKYIKKVIVIDNTAKKEFKSKIKCGNKTIVVDDQPDLQVNPAWNYGVNLCDTKYYLLLNDDILWNSDVIQSCLNVVEKNDRYSVLTVVTRRESFDEYNKGFPVTTPKIITAAVPLNHIEGGWFVFGKKDEWIDIPSELKIFYGDNFIFENAVIKHKKKIGKILTQYICHIVSITVTSLHLYEEGLLQTEGKIYEKIRAKIR
jgi:tetratricopeptide (TPR) repeat protein